MSFVPSTEWIAAMGALAREAALIAWGRIADLRHGEYAITEKKDGPTTEADLLADRTLREVLAARSSGANFAFLTEETADDRARMDADAVWIVDPIDGTNDFVEDRDDFAIHVALVARNGEGTAMELVASAVYEPAHGRLYTARRGAGAFVEEALRGPSEPHWWEGVPLDKRTPERALFAPPRRLVVSANSHITECTAVVSRSHLTRRLRAALEAMPLRHFYRRGSLGVKICDVAEAAADFYLLTERGRAHQWDLAAPQLILEEAGGVVTDLDGSAIRYNGVETALPAGIIASNGACHEAVMACLAKVELLRA